MAYSSDDLGLLALALVTFQLVAYAPSLWAAGLDPRKPLRVRYGVRTMLVAIALVAVESAAWTRWMQSQRLSAEYSSRASAHRMHADLCRFWSSRYADFTESDLGTSGGSGRDAEIVEYVRAAAKADGEALVYHEALRQKYERAVQSPLLPVAPDPAPPGRPKPPHGLEQWNWHRPIGLPAIVRSEGIGLGSPGDGSPASAP